MSSPINVLILLRVNPSLANPELMIFIGGRNLALSMLCNESPTVGLLFFTVKIYVG